MALVTSSTAARLRLYDEKWKFLILFHPLEVIPGVAAVVIADKPFIAFDFPFDLLKGAVRVMDAGIGFLPGGVADGVEYRQTIRVNERYFSLR